MKQQKKAARAEQRREARKTAKSLADVLKKTKKDKIAPKSSKLPFSGSKDGNRKTFPGKQSSDGYQKKRKASSVLDETKPVKKRDQKRDRQAQKPNAALVGEMKHFWNLAREKNVSQNDRDGMISSIVAKMKGNILQVTLRHDASRAVQCILQFGTVPQRWQVLNEMSERFSEIAKTPYGHFVVLKAVTYCTEEAERTLINNSLRGHFVSLGTNVIGARTVETILQLWPKNLTKGLKAEFYGHKFLATLSETPGSLRALVEALPAKRDSLLDHMRDLCQRFVDKSLLEFSYVHQLLWEYISECEGLTSRLADLVNLLADSVLKLITTKPGARVMCIIISNSTAKDRKKIMKALKGHVLESLLHESGHLAIMRLVDVTDDTVNVQKMILDEIMITKPILKYSASGEQINDPFPPLIKIAKHQFGRKLLLRLLSPNKRHLEPDEESLFSVESIAAGTSKKSPSVRRHEHVVYLRNPLLQISANYLHYLVTCQMGSSVLLEVVATFFPSQILTQLIEMFCGRYHLPETQDNPESAMVAASNPDDEDEVEDEEDDESGDDSAHDDDEEDEDEDEYDNEDLQEALKEDEENYGEDSEVPSQSNVSTSSYPLPDLNVLEENAIAQLLLKRILDIQSTVEVDSEKAAIDTTMWEKVDNEDDTFEYFRFAQELIHALFPTDSEDILPQWIQKNRPSFILSDLLKVPSVRQEFLEKLKPFKKQIKSNSKTIAGVKCLLTQMEKK